MEILIAEEEVNTAYDYRMMLEDRGHGVLTTDTIKTPEEAADESTEALWADRMEMKQQVYF